MKKLMLLIVLLVGVLALSACDTNDDYVDNEKNNDEEVENEEQEEQLMDLTLEELAMYDGQDGNDAYIAVNGVIYDVTNVSAWNNGTHNGNVAGTDVSSVINNAPHGDSVLSGLTVVGNLVE
mgnify:CR=1 FL=1